MEKADPFGLRQRIERFFLEGDSRRLHGYAYGTDPSWRSASPNFFYVRFTYLRILSSLHAALPTNDLRIRICPPHFFSLPAHLSDIPVNG